MKPFDEDLDVAPPPSEPKERRYVYNGGGSPPPAREEIRRGNRPVTRRRRSPFNLILAMVLVSILIVLYVWNKLTVNRLAMEINDLQMQCQKVQYSNEVLRAEVNRKSSLERIGKIATDKLGMTYTKTQPVPLDIDEQRLEKLQP
ncbi:MAG TPA: cell division protein FtsL [Bacteroidota bacterium]|jgi:cell division protein FtsL|nr:cell division protein FtsL [Bacteroidota bacterium]